MNKNPTAANSNVWFAGAGCCTSVPANRVIYLTQTEPAEPNTRLNIHIRHDNDKKKAYWYFKFIRSFSYN